jgi:hypothetical protein
MKVHEPLVRQLAKSAIVGDRFAELIRRWEQNNEPPPKPEPKCVSCLDRLTSLIFSPNLFRLIPLQKRWGAARAVDPEDEYFNADEEEPVAGRQTRGQLRKRGGLPAAAGNAPNRRPQRPINVALPRAYPIGGPLVDYEEDETPDGALPPQDPVKQQPEQKAQDGRLRGRGNRRPDLARTASSANLDPNRSIERAQESPSAGASTSSNPNEQRLRSPSPSRRQSSSSEIGPVAMDEDDDLIGPPVPLSHKRRREAEEDDETLERLAKRPALAQESNGAAAPGATPMEAESTVQPEPSRSKKRQLRVKLGDTPLAAQPPDVKVGDKG